MFVCLSMYSRVSHIFLDFKVSMYIEGYSFWSILRQPPGQTQDNFNFGPSLLKF